VAIQSIVVADYQIHDTVDAAISRTASSLIIYMVRREICDTIVNWTRSSRLKNNIKKNTAISPHENTPPWRSTTALSRFLQKPSFCYPASLSRTSESQLCGSRSMVSDRFRRLWSLKKNRHGSISNQRPSKPFCTRGLPERAADAPCKFGGIIVVSILFS